MSNRYQNNNIHSLTSDDKITTFTHQTVEFSACINRDNFWLLSNQLVNQQLGYDVLTTIDILRAGEQVNRSKILLNLGWINKNNANTFSLDDHLKRLNNHFSGNLPSCQPISITGRVKKPYDLPFVTNIFSSSNSILEITPDSFPVKGLIKDAYLEVDENHPLALRTHWKGSTIESNRHYGYALQWFLMACAMCVYLKLSFKKHSLSKKVNSA